MLFSDELGNHQLYFATNLIIDLKNSSYLLAYYNLTNRTNYGIQGFHNARFLYTIPDPGYEQYYAYFYSRFTTWGVSGIASYPFDRFTRLDLSLAAQVHSKDVIDATVFVPTKTKYSLVPSVSYVLDNTSWSYFYPKSGTRWNISVSASPGLATNFIGFFTPAVDIRHYVKLFGGVSFAARFSGAVSLGPNPQKFYLGGMDGWINSYTSTYAYPITEPEDISFYGIGLPLRGYAFNERIGTKYMLTNLALRFPFPIFVGGAPLGLFAEAFMDAGTAWNKDLYLFRVGKNKSIMTDDLLTSAGIGFRTYFFGFYLKMDIAWRTNLQSSSHPQYLFSIGQDF
jgi:outer membrane protein assembly factor BamA